MDPVARLGRPAPEFRLSDLAGKVHQLAEANGNLVVLNFWSAECIHSTRADEQIQGLQLGWGERVLVWSIASNANEGLDELRSAAEQRGVAPVLRDKDQIVADEYGAVTTPHIFVIDEAGQLRFAGALDDVSFNQLEPTINYLEQAIARLLSGKNPDPSAVPPYGCALVRMAT